MIALAKIRELDIARPSAAGRPSYLSAASGLVCVKSFLYVITDDELHLGVFDNAHRKPGHLIRLFEGELPSGHQDRKKKKPDFEVIMLTPPFGPYPHGALLAMGSGSKQNRRMGALVALDGQGAIAGVPRVIDLSHILNPLDSHFPDLNIEGAVAVGDELRLLQRGNKRQSRSAMIRLPLAAFLNGLCNRQPEIITPISITAFDLGHINDIPLTFTDAASLPNGDVVFTAVTEDTNDSFNDGLCVGAAIGVIGNDGALRWLRHLTQPRKVEGLDARIDGDTLELLVVTDADDVSIAAGLYSARIAMQPPSH